MDLGVMEVFSNLYDTMEPGWCELLQAVMMALPCTVSGGADAAAPSPPHWVSFPVLSKRKLLLCCRRCFQNQGCSELEIL